MAAQQRGCGLVPPQLLMLFLLPPLPPSIDPMKRMQAHRIAGSAKWWALPLLEAKQHCNKTLELGPVIASRPY